MPIEAGQELLHYRVVEKIGAGAMGEVWKATDTTLGREVAIKTLPNVFAQDAERLARFEREARVLASLNHPGIATIHGLHAGGEVKFLAMEYLPGEDLGERLARGPLPVDRAMNAARQIAAALEAAHEQGVVHRDLKPANVRATEDGPVKVLDFGLAKATSPEASSSGSAPSISPTLTSAGTAAGVILGTAAYMSPEQARGKPLDRRSDIWSFGCLLYEMLTAKRVFAGETVSDTIAAVLTTEPDWDALPKDTPRSVRRLLARCLDRDPMQRLRDIGEARIVLEDPGEADVVADTAGRRSRWKEALAVIGAAAVVAFGLGWLAGSIGGGADGSTVGAVRIVSDVAVPGEGHWSLNPAGPGPVTVSPDGTRLAFCVIEDGQSRLYIRSLDDPQATLVEDSEGAQYPFWAPLGDRVGFFARGSLRVADLSEQRVRALAEALDGKGGSWSPDGVLLYTPNAGNPLWAIREDGGEPWQVTTFEAVGGTSHRHPRFLADGNRFLFMARGERVADNRIMVGSMDGTAPRELFGNVTQAELVGNRILWVEEGVLYARDVDPDTLEMLGERRAVASEVLQLGSASIGAFSATPSLLAHHLGNFDHDMRLVRVVPGEGSSVVFDGLAGLQQFSLSPDGTKVAAVIENLSTSEPEMWVLDLDRGVKTRMTETPAQIDRIVWTPDGDSLIYAGSTVEDFHDYHVLFMRPVFGGAGREILRVDNDVVTGDVSPDGRWVLFAEEEAASGSDLYAFRLDDDDAPPIAVATSRYFEGLPRFSPDGRWVSYISNETGSYELFVAPFPALDRKWQVSRDGAIAHAWTPDGSALLFKFKDETVLEVAFDAQSGRPEFGSPRPIARAPHVGLIDLIGEFDVDPQGRLITADGEASQDDKRLSLIIGW